MTDTDGPVPFDGVDVEFLDGEMVVGRRSLPRWSHPADEWQHVDGRTYDVYGFTGPAAQSNGRQLFRVFVRPRSTPTDPVSDSPETAPA